MLGELQVVKLLGVVTGHACDMHKEGGVVLGERNSFRLLSYSYGER